MPNSFFDHPILNSPYERPNRHWELDATGQPTQQILDHRRRAQFITPIPKPKKHKKTATQQDLLLEEGHGLSTQAQQYDPTSVINDVRNTVDAWRALPNPNQWQVTPTTARLLQHWRHHPFNGIRPFFCQVEAAETAIWLSEVAPQSQNGKRLIAQLAAANHDANPELLRVALKLATGAGKTTVMAMLIAWQTLNAVRHPASKQFSRGFLICAPGLTIKDRLRVLQPNDPDSYYKDRELVPVDLLPDVSRAKMVITNYHAFRRRERTELSKGGRQLLQGRTGDAPQTLETEGQMIQRVMPELMGMKGIFVINDEAHHCYREKPDADQEALKGDDKREAEKNNEAARLWISGLETVKRTLGITRLIDLSATPFFLRGSGYAEGTLFPWTVSDFSLMDAIECGIVKLPRVPVAENIPGDELPMFRNLWESIRKDLPKKGRGAQQSLDPLKLPTRLQIALQALYGHYEQTFALWQEHGIKVPPCFIVVCQNTAISKLVYDFIAGFQRQNADGSTILAHRGLALFGNFDAYSGQPLPRPNTLLIDSEQLEAGDALDERFRSMAAAEIAQFRRDLIERSGDARAGERITDQELLREVMNTVGKAGQLGGSIRCVVSVSMLNEGWDCLDVETEVLTAHGWRGYGQISPGDGIYSFNRHTEKIERVTVLEYGERPVRDHEHMVHIKSQHLNIRVTEGHQFHIKYRDPRHHGQLVDHTIVKTARELHGRRSGYALPLAAECAEPFPGLPLSDDEIRLIAWFMTDGGFSGYRLAIAQAKQFHHEIRALLGRIGLDFSESFMQPGKSAYPNATPYYRFSIPKGTRKDALSRKGWYSYHEYLDKHVSAQLHKMTREQFIVFWQELLKGDGEKQGHRSGWLWCSEKTQVDAYSQMAILRGFAASYSERVTKTGKTVYRLSIRDTRWITSNPSDKRASKVMLEKPRDNEIVWCVRNRNSTLITRRHGKIAIIGNCNTVTHVLGIRAFGTQLLCEQVIGRALRRQSYELNDEGLFNVEYADVFGIPFDFNAKPVVAPPQPPRETVQVRAMRPERDALEITFPRVEGYRVELPEERLAAAFTAESVLVLSPELVGPSVTQNAGIIGQSVDLSLKHLGERRMATVVFHLVKRLLYTHWREPGAEPRLHLFGELKRITQQWLEGYLQCTGGTYPALLIAVQELADMACNKITAAITRQFLGVRPIKALLDPYNPTGSTRHVRFNTSKADRWQTSSQHCHLNWVVLDSDWEAEFCRVVEAHPQVRAYVKNHSLGFEVPYRAGSAMRHYRPDFIVLVDDGHGPADVLHLVVEIKGYRREDAKEKKSTMETYWIPGVNHLGTYGRWAFAEFTDVFQMQDHFAQQLASGFHQMIASAVVPTESGRT